MLHLPPQFLHPLDHRLPFGGFRPLGPSAFAPPSKCLKVETGNGPVTGSGLPSIGSLSSMSNMFSPSSLSSASGGAVVSVSGASASIGGVGGVGGVGGGASGASGQEVAPQSPAGSTSRSPTGTGTGSVPNRGTTPEDEDRDANATPGSENTERSTPEEGRPYRREFPHCSLSFLLPFLYDSWPPLRQQILAPVYTVFLSRPGKVLRAEFSFSLLTILWERIIPCDPR